MTGRSQADWARVLRRALVGLGALGGAATGIELAMQRHWHSGSQLIPWISLGVLIGAAALVVVRPARERLLAGVAVALGVAGSSVYGVVAHVQANLNAGPLDFRFERTWATMSASGRFWKAFTDVVGHSPTLAPGALAFAALCIALSTLGHPALARRSTCTS